MIYSFFFPFPYQEIVTNSGTRETSFDHMWMTCNFIYIEEIKSLLSSSFLSCCLAHYITFTLKFFTKFETKTTLWQHASKNRFIKSTENICKKSNLSYFKTLIEPNVEISSQIGNKHPSIFTSVVITSLL